MEKFSNVLLQEGILKFVEKIWTVNCLEIFSFCRICQSMFSKILWKNSMSMFFSERILRFAGKSRVNCLDRDLRKKFGVESCFLETRSSPFENIVFKDIYLEIC